MLINGITSRAFAVCYKYTKTKMPSCSPEFLIPMRISNPVSLRCAYLSSDSVDVDLPKGRRPLERQMGSSSWEEVGSTIHPTPRKKFNLKFFQAKRLILHGSITPKLSAFYRLIHSNYYQGHAFRKIEVGKHLVGRNFRLK